MVQNKLLIPNQRGINLHSIHFIAEERIISKGKKKNPIVILCHGFTGDKYEWGRFTTTAESLNNEEIDALIFDFSGSGENEREFITLSNQVKDLEIIYDWVKKEGYSWVAIVGLSFGGLTALIAHLPEIITYIFWAPAFYFKEMFLSSLEQSLKKQPIEFPSSSELRPIMIDHSFAEDLAKYNVNKYLERLKKPCLIIQGTRDRDVRPRFTREAFNHISHDKHHKLIEVEKATHNFEGEYLNKFIDLSIEWLKSFI